MGFKELQEEIESAAKDDADQKKREAKRDAERIMEAANKKLDAYQKKLEEERRQVINNYKETTLSSAKFTIKKKIYNKKKEIMDRVYERVMSVLRDMDEKKREEHLKYLLSYAENTLDPSVVYCNEKDKDLLGSKYSIQTKNIPGGLLAENRERTERIDLSYETLLKAVYDEHSNEIGKILFNEP